MKAEIQNINHGQSNNYFEWLKAHWLFLSIALIVLAKNWLLEVVPFVARDGFRHDDSLFIRLAASIVDGKWLGEFDQYILIKGPIYPLWIAFNYYLGLDIIHTQDLLFLFACLVILKAISADVKNQAALLLIFVFLYLNPVSFDYLSISHAFRMVIYTSLTLLCFGALLGLFLRLYSQDRKYIYWSVLFGISISLFWYTREEGEWLLPGIALIAGSFIFFQIYKRQWRQFRSAIIGFIIVPVMLWGGTTGILGYMNWKNYGMFYVIEVMTPNFTRAYNALLKIEPQEFRRYYPVRTTTIEKLFELSPKIKELSTFEGLDDFTGAQFIWAFRKAVDHAGYYSQGAQYADQYYSDLADELEALCENERVVCNEQLLSYVTVWRPEYTNEFGSSFIKLFKRVIRFKDFSMSQDGFYSTGGTTYLNSVQKLTHARIQLYEKQVFYPDSKFFEPLSEFKTNVLSVLGKSQLWIRPALFYLAVILLVVAGIRDLMHKRYNPYTIYSMAVLGSIVTLVVGITIIDLTAYRSLFRPLHGVLPLPPLFIITVVLAWSVDRSLYEKE